MFCLLAGVSRVALSAQSSDKHRFHVRCSDGVTLRNSRRTAECYSRLHRLTAGIAEPFRFTAGAVFSHEPLADDQLFEVKMDNMVLIIIQFRDLIKSSFLNQL